jgi:saccharopepsin
VLDTSTSNFWIPSSRCTSLACFIHSKYDSSESSTYAQNGSRFDSPYRSGSVSGFISQDVLHIGDLKIKKQDFGEIIEEKGVFFASPRFDGILGLGFDTNSIEHATPPFYNMINQNLLDEPVFAFNIANEDEESEVIFGGIDPKHYTGELIKLPLRDKSRWEVDLDAMSFGDETLELEKAGVVFDTSASLITLPKGIAESLNGKLDAKNFYGVPYLVDCHKKETAPDMNFHLSGNNFTISASDYIIEIKGTCYSGFVGLDTTEVAGPLVFLGDIFLRRYYSVYDLGNNAVGLAKAA